MHTKQQTALMLVSLSVLGLELWAMRALSWVGWSSFAALVIGIALAGFGLAGSLLTLYRDQWLRRLDVWQPLLVTAFVGSSLAAARLLPHIPFLPQALASDSGQLWWLGCRILLLLLPFFCGACFIQLAWLAAGPAVGRAYAWNLLGSALGAGLTVWLAQYLFPWQLELVWVLPALLALLLVVDKGTRWVAAVVVPICLLLFALASPYPMSPYKAVPLALRASRTRVMNKRPGAHGCLHVLSGPQFRFAPGLSLQYQQPVPPEPALFRDGHPAGSLATNPGTPVPHAAWVPFSLPFRLREGARVLLLGSGGGHTAAWALALGAIRVTVVEPDAALAGLLRQQGVFRTPQPRLSLQVGDLRAWCRSGTNRYSVIALPGMARGGISLHSGAGRGEDYLFTVQGLRSILARLDENGLLYLSLRRKSPPRALPRLLVLAFRTLEQSQSPRQAAQCLALVRGMDWGALVLKKQPFTVEEIRLLRERCAILGFDPVWLPGIRQGETTRFHQMDQDFTHELVLQLAVGKAETLISQSPYRIFAPTDERPFFRQYLTPRLVVASLQGRPDAPRLPPAEFDYLLLWAGLGSALLLGLILILLPLLLGGQRVRRERGKGRTFLYFLALGMGFMLVEIAAIQQLSLLVGDPLLSAALVISSLLAWCGLGAGLSVRLGRGRLPLLWVVVAIVACLIAVRLWLAPLVNSLLSWPLGLRALACVLLLAPLGIAMGMPFPMGLRALGARAPRLEAWALAVNGAFSIAGALSADLLAREAGFSAVFLAGGVAYLLAVAVVPASRSRTTPQSPKSA